MVVAGEVCVCQRDVIKPYVVADGACFKLCEGTHRHRLVALVVSDAGEPNAVAVSAAREAVELAELFEDFKAVVGGFQLSVVFIEEVAPYHLVLQPSGHRVVSAGMKIDLIRESRQLAEEIGEQLADGHHIGRSLNIDIE